LCLITGSAEKGFKDVAESAESTKSFESASCTAEWIFSDPGVSVAVIIAAFLRVTKNLVSFI
jgi:hypothetical protein